MGVIVDDAGDERLADYRNLVGGEPARDGDHVVAEGALTVQRALRSNATMRSLVVSAERSEAIAPVIGEVPGPTYVVPRKVLRAVTGFDVHRGVLAAFDRPASSSVERVTGGGGPILVVEDVNDHENMGALFRNAAAFGVSGMILSPRCCDPLYRRSLRVSVGHALHVPFAIAPTWPGALGGLRDAGYSVIALTPAGDESATSALDGPAGSPTAVVVGAEGRGLSDAALDACPRRVRIEMAAGVDSLNVATAAAVALHRLFS